VAPNHSGHRDLVFGLPGQRDDFRLRDRCAFVFPERTFGRSSRKRGSNPRGLVTFCTFQPKEGVEETYIGTAYGVSISADEEVTFIWVVRSPSEPAVKPGQLQQIFANDSSHQPEQKPPLIGSESLALHSLSDRPEGSVSSPDKPTPTGFVILRLELQLRSSIG